MNTLRCLLAAILTVAAISSASAAAYIKFDGVDGEAQHKDHKNWIDVQSVADVPAAPPTTREAGSGMATGRRQYNPIRFSKRIDKSTPLLARAHSAQTVFPSVTLAHGGRTYTLTNARIVKIAASGNTEEISFNFEKIEVVDTSPPRAPENQATQAPRGTPGERLPPPSTPATVNP